MEEGDVNMLYVYYENLNQDSYIGVKKKIIAQCRSFRKAFGNIYYTIYAGQTIYLMQDGKVMEKEYAITRQMRNDAILNWLIKYDIKRVYIRYLLSDLWFVEFLKELKTMELKRIIEFPTIPYDGEGGITRPEEDRYYREQLYPYIDCCTTYSNCETVFHIPCIPLVNGVDIVEHKRKKYRKQDGRIVLLAVASMSKWHGYERVIQGMRQYYLNGGKKNILFNIAGNGGQIQYYKKLVSEYRLQEHVVFRGQLSGKKLDELYDNSDIAVGSLGFYKAGLQSGAPIKLREYCARGIPFIYAYQDISFHEGNDYAYRIPNDETPVDIEKIIDFYEMMYDGRDFIEEMRQYTVENLTWDSILQPVIDYLS